MPTAIHVSSEIPEFGRIMCTVVGKLAADSTWRISYAVRHCRSRPRVIPYSVATTITLAAGEVKQPQEDESIGRVPVAARGRERGGNEPWHTMRGRSRVGGFSELGSFRRERAGTPTAGPA